MNLMDLLFYPNTLLNVNKSIHPMLYNLLCYLYIIYIDDTILLSKQSRLKCKSKMLFLLLQQ